MKDLPESDTKTLVIRTDFSDEAAWACVCREMEAPGNMLRDGSPELSTSELTSLAVELFHAYMLIVSDPDFAELSTSAVNLLARRGPYRGPLLFIIDRVSLTDPEHPILALDLDHEPGQTFPVLAREMCCVGMVISLKRNFEYFANSVDTDGVFRGFPKA